MFVIIFLITHESIFILLVISKDMIIDYIDYPNKAVSFTENLNKHHQKLYKGKISCIDYELKQLFMSDNQDVLILLKRSLDRYKNDELHKSYASVIYVLQYERNYKSALLFRKIYRLDEQYNYTNQCKKIIDYYINESFIAPKINEREDDIIIPEKKILVVKNGYNETSRIELPIAHDKITINGVIV